LRFRVLGLGYRGAQIAGEYVVGFGVTDPRSTSDRKPSAPTVAKLLRDLGGGEVANSAITTDTIRKIFGLMDAKHPHYPQYNNYLVNQQALACKQMYGRRGLPPVSAPRALPRELARVARGGDWRQPTPSVHLLAGKGLLVDEVVVVLRVVAVFGVHKPENLANGVGGDGGIGHLAPSEVPQQLCGGLHTRLPVACGARVRDAETNDVLACDLCAPEPKSLNIES